MAAADPFAPPVAFVAEALGVEAQDEAGLREVVARGLPASVLARLCERGVLRPEELAALRGRTWYGARRVGPRLTRREGERVLRVVRATWMARECLGGEDAAASWLRSQVPFLGGRTPLAVLAGERGEAEIVDLLTRITYGIYS